MIETLIFAIVLLMVTILLIYKPIPILAFPVELVSLYICVIHFLPSEDLPSQPFFTFFIIVINVLGLVVNALELRRE